MMTRITIEVKISTPGKFDGTHIYTATMPEKNLPRLSDENFANLAHGTVLLALDNYDEGNCTNFGELGDDEYGN